MSYKLYTYKVKEIVKIYDGDTITVVLDLGMKMYVQKTIRLYGIDTPEIRGEERPEGLVSREWLVEKLNKAEDVYITTHRDKSGKYGRLLGSVYINEEIISLNEQLVHNGLAEFREY